MFNIVINLSTRVCLSGLLDFLILLYLFIYTPFTLSTLIPKRWTSTPCSNTVKINRESLRPCMFKKLNSPLQSLLCNLRNAPHPQHLLSRAPAAGAFVWACYNPLARLSAPHRAFCPCLHRAPLTAYLGAGCASLPSGTLGCGDPDRDATWRLHPVQRGTTSMRWPQRG